LWPRTVLAYRSSGPARPIPVWLTLGVAILVILFGVHRIRLSFRSEDEEARTRQRKGLYAMSRRTHRLIGVVYILLGAALVGASLGWSPFGDLFGPPTDAPAKDKAPAAPGVQLDQQPPPPKQ
jgi:hypothetical protein